MTERQRDAVIGLTALVGVLGMFAMLLAFGSLREYARDTYVVEVRMNRAGGLRYGSQVTLDGVPIGTIGDVSLQIEEPLPVRLDCDIDTWASIPVDHLVKVDAALIGGGARLAIVSLDPAANRTVFAPGAVPTLAGSFLPMDEALSGALDARMAPITESFAEVGALASVYRELGTRLTDLVQRGGDGGEGLATTIQRINGTLVSADQAFAAATAWLDDAQLREDARSAVFKANLFIERATDAAMAAGELASTLDAEAPGLIERLSLTVASVDDTLTEVRQLARLAGDGEGTVGRLLNDPALYEDLDDAARRLDATLATLKITIEAINEDGVRVEF